MQSTTYYHNQAIADMHNSKGAQSITLPMTLMNVDVFGSRPRASKANDIVAKTLMNNMRQKDRHHLVCPRPEVYDHLLLAEAPGGDDHPRMT